VGEIVVTAHDFPYFMYDPNLMEEDDTWARLCRGYVLIWVRLHLFSVAPFMFLLQTIEEMFFGNGKPQITKHATKDPIAVKFGLTSITPEIVVYGACQVRHSASKVSMYSR
jgi:hypothetical protein